MKRITVRDFKGNFEGWFDLEASTEIARVKSGNPYIYGRILLATASGKLIINEWTNTGTDFYRFANDDKEIAEILAGGLACGKEVAKKLAAILADYEL